MPRESSIVIASNRGPISFLPADDGFATKRGAGGLAGALDPVARELGIDAVWVAAAVSETDREALHAGAADQLPELLGYSVYLLDIEPEMYSKYYDVVSNQMLWFANHCLWDELHITNFGADEIAAWDEAYEPVNHQFASAICEVAEPDGLVLVQDYHLSRLPLFLRELRPDQTIFHFTHSSFCGPDGLGQLPDPLPRKVIEGMLGADLVGLHVAPWVHAFFDCAEKIGATVDRREGSVTYSGRRTWVRAYPIPVDPSDLKERAHHELASDWARNIEASADGPLIVRADRAEPSKNIVRGFEAFGMLLDRRADLRDAKFVACIYPSRETMDVYQRYTREIEESVARVNERHPDSIKLYMKDDFDRTLGAYRVYDVLLVNPLMDGMNLVSKEGPVVNERDGILVLSKGAGSYQEMGDPAIVIDDARSVERTADALERALDMSPEERARRAEELRAAARRTQPSDWIDAQLADLEAIKAGNPPVRPACLLRDQAAQ
ncbi:MAG: alpha,alpha-trehalose-phosphate synthase (UDP-forming) [Actinomycetota bacterium]